MDPPGFQAMSSMPAIHESVRPHRKRGVGSILWRAVDAIGTGQVRVADRPRTVDAVGARSQVRLQSTSALDSIAST